MTQVQGMKKRVENFVPWGDETYPGGDVTHILSKLYFCIFTCEVFIPELYANHFSTMIAMFDIRIKDFFIETFPNICPKNLIMVHVIFIFRY